MEKELVLALEKLEKLANSGKIESYTFNSRRFKGEKEYYFDIVESLKDRKMSYWVSAEKVLNNF
jgi:hypothetical protein